MINDMGIEVHEVAPDAETCCMPEGPGPATTDRHRRSRRRALRARFRSRPHHRPGAHVHARDGHGGTADARRRNRHRQAHRGRPDPGPVGAGQLPVVDPDAAGGIRPAPGRQEAPFGIVVGFADIEAPDRIAAVAESEDESRGRQRRRGGEDEEETTTPDEPARIRPKSRAAWKPCCGAVPQVQKAHAKSGSAHKAVLKVREEMAAEFLTAQAAAGDDRQLVRKLREVVNAEIRSHERASWICASPARKMPRKDFLRAFPGHETNLAGSTKMRASRSGPRV
jgi:RNA polymerase primary sigma factor